MNRKSRRILEDDQRLAERAAEWLGVLRNPSPQEREEFADWTLASPRHLGEFLMATAIVRELKDMDESQLAPLRERIESLSANVVELAHSSPKAIARIDAGTDTSRHWRRYGWALAAAAAIVAVIGFQVITPRWQTYATLVGEERTVTLPDGSRIHLDTRSRLQVRLDGRSREVQLLEGEALFTVTHDSKRPFRVRSGASVIQALGTEFNVLRRPSGTTVAVIEGLVQISTAPFVDGSAGKVAANAASPSAVSRLGAGEEARITGDGKIEKRAPVDALSIAMPRKRRLDFQGDTLADIAAEFNRFNHRPQIVIVGEDVRARHYTGMFDAGDPQSLIDFLRGDPGLEVEAQGDELVIHPR